MLIYYPAFKGTPPRVAGIIYASLLPLVSVENKFVNPFTITMYKPVKLRSEIGGICIKWVSNDRSLYCISCVGATATASIDNESLKSAHASHAAVTGATE